MKEVRAELVRVDSHGTAHPIGTVASQRLRSRPGAYRLMPAPDHVVFMRFTGEDGQRDESDGALVRLAGEITAGAMGDVLALLAQAGWRGELVVFDGEDTRSVFFEQGNVVGAQTSVEDERLGSVLYRFGALTEEQLEQIMERVRAGRRFGDVAIELGLLSQEKVYEFIGKQVEEVVFGTLAVSDGTFFFLDGFDESKLVSRHTVSATMLLMDGVTRLDELAYFRQKIPSGDYVPVRVDGKGEPAGEYANIYKLVDGRRSVEDLGRETGLGEFETAKQVYALIQSKHVTMHPPRMSGGPTAIVETANAVLRTILASADEMSRGEEVRQSLGSFAVGAGVYDILFRNAGPDQNGAFDPEAVAENLVLVAAGGDAENVLKQMLHEYVSFALFSVGSVVDAARESTIKKEVGAMLARLRPQG